LLCLASQGPPEGRAQAAEAARGAVAGEAERQITSVRIDEGWDDRGLGYFFLAGVPSPVTHPQDLLIPWAAREATAELGTYSYGFLIAELEAKGVEYRRISVVNDLPLYALLATRAAVGLRSIYEFVQEGN